MTPHIVRIPDITDDDLAPMWVGTTNNLTFRGVTPRIESQSSADPFTAPATRGVNPMAVDRQGNTVPAPMPAMPSNPGFVPPSGGLPTDPFRNNPQVQPPPPQPQPQSQSQSQSRSSSNSIEPAAQIAAVEVEAAAEPDQAALRFAPRIAPQPAGLSLKPGEQKLWTVVGMDLDGLHTDGIVFRYDASAMEVLDVSFGSAFQIDPKTPPVVTIDRAAGLVRIRPSNGQSLLFNSGGELLLLRVQGGTPGDTSLVFAQPELKNNNGDIVVAAVSGGRARVQ
jgi:hypothetical protein